jgi:DNA-binding LacI/PurR family transcriptional regulator
VADIENYILRHLDSRSHDAVIFIRDDHRIRPALLTALQRQKVRVAAIMPERNRLGKMPLACLDRPRAASLLLEALAAAGHRHIDYVHPPGAPAASFRGVKDVGRRLDLALRWVESPPVHHHETETFKAGVELVRTDLRFSKATGVAVFTENMAVGIAHGFHLFGLDVPEQKSIVGYGDLACLEVNEPALDAVSHPICEIGQSIARQTIEWIESGYVDAAARKRQFFPCYYPRESVKKISAFKKDAGQGQAGL